MSGVENNPQKNEEDQQNMITATSSSQNSSSCPPSTRLKQIYDLSRFEKSHANNNSGNNSRCCLNLSDGVKRVVNKTSKKMRDTRIIGEWVKKRVPIVDWLPKYKPKKYLLPDAMAGLTVGIMNIPQGLAYALLATLNPIYGLYVSFFPIIVYTILGTCRHLIIGGVAIISLITGTVIDEMVLEHFRNGTSANTTESQFRVDIACQLSLLVGLIQFLMGVVGLGFISSYFSDTFISGYTCASAIHVVMSQLKDIFGLKKLTKYNGIFKIPKSFVEFLMKINTSNWVTLGFSIGCMLFLIICKEVTNPLIKKRLHFEFPSELALIIIMTSVSYFADLKQNFNISIIESIPTGLPSPGLPHTTYLLPLLKDALLIATISFSVSVSLSSLYSRKKKYKINPKQELYALGLSGLTGSVFSCYPIAGSLSRTSVVVEMGGKTQVASLFSSSVLIVVILWLAPFLKTLPNLCLASVIVVALKGLLFQMRDLVKLWRVNKLEFITWIVTFLSVVILDVDWGLFIGVGVSILTVIWRDQTTPLRALSKPANTYSLFREDFVNPESTHIDEPIHCDKEIKVYRVEHSIYFANCKKFAQNIYKLNKLKPSAHVQPSVLHQHSVNNSRIDEEEEESSAADVDNVNEENNRRKLESDKAELDSVLIGVSDTNGSIDENLGHRRRAPAQDTTRKRHITNSTNGTTGNNILIDVHEHRALADDFILDFSAVNYIDTNGIQIVEELVEDFKHLGVFVYICRPQESFLKMICRLKLVDKFDAHVFLTIEDAVRHFNNKNLSSR